MKLGLAVAVAALCLIGGYSSRNIKRLHNTSRGLLLLGWMMAAYCALTLLMMNKYAWP